MGRVLCPLPARTPFFRDSLLDWFYANRAVSCFNDYGFLKIGLRVVENIRRF